MKINLLVTLLTSTLFALPIEDEKRAGHHDHQMPMVLRGADKIHPSCVCSSSSSSSSSSCTSSFSCITEYPCSPCDAVQTVINKDNDLIALINKHNWSAVSVLVHPDARFNVLDEHNGICLRQSGCIKNFWMLYKGVEIFDIIQNVQYIDCDGSVEVRAVEVSKYKGKTLNVRDITRTYRSSQGCDYKLSFVSGTSFLCRTN